MTNTDTHRRAIIMGATSGIGMEVARELVRRGWRLGIAGRRVERLKELREELPQVVAVKQIDVTDDGAAQRLGELIEETGGMDLYFHSSGIGWQNMGLDAEKEILTAETNVVGFTRMVTAAFNYFAGHENQTEHEGRIGHIAVISSIAGTKGLGAAAAYSSTKRYQNHYVECLEQLARMRKLKICFTDVRPGFVATDLIKDGRYPMKLRTDDVARMIVRAIEKRKAVATVDWRYRLLVFLWRMVPRRVWVRLHISS